MTEAIRKKILRRDLGRTLLFLCWVGIWWLGSWYYDKQHFNYTKASFMAGWRTYLLIGVAMLLGFFFFGMHKVLLDFPKKGTILAVSYTHAFVKDHGGIDGMLTVLTVSTDFRKRKIRFPLQDMHTNYYRPGAKFRKYHGVPYPMSENEEYTLCLNCGRAQEKGNRCVACGFALPEETSL